MIDMLPHTMGTNKHDMAELEHEKDKKSNESSDIVATTLSEMDAEAMFCLGPMVRGSELAFRQLVRQQGRGSSSCPNHHNNKNWCYYSPMLRAEQIIKAHDLEQRGEKDKITHEDGLLLWQDVACDPEPVVVQICGNSPEVLKQAVHILCQVTPHLEGIDFNLGCPQICAREGNFGAFLAQEQPAQVKACVASMRQALEEYYHANHANKNNNKVRPRLSCKIRLLESNIQETIDFAKGLVEAGCELLAVHCRKCADKHDGIPNWKAGRALVEALSSPASSNGTSVPVIVNGGLNSLEDIRNALEQTGAHGVMLARGALANPLFLVQPNACPAALAAAYLEYATKYPPPGPLFIRKHLRWIFRSTLEPPDPSNVDYWDWRPRLWTFLVRPYLTSMTQFRQVVVLYVNLTNENNTDASSKIPMPESLQNEPIPTFKSIRHANRKKPPSPSSAKSSETMATSDNKHDASNSQKRVKSKPENI